MTDNLDNNDKPLEKKRLSLLDIYGSNGSLDSYVRSNPKNMSKEQLAEVCKSFPPFSEMITKLDQ